MEQVASGSRRITYDARGLAEPDVEAPRTAVIEDGTASLTDYRRLLLALRPQVVEGGRWIARAASNFSPELFDLRSELLHGGASAIEDWSWYEEYRRHFRSEPLKDVAVLALSSLTRFFRY